MTTPFFLIIFAKFILNEKLNSISWIAIIIGFIGVLIVLKPTNTNINIHVFLVLLVAITNALSFTVVNKYSYMATTYGFTFYGIAPATLFFYLFFFIDPMIPSGKEFLLFGNNSSDKFTMILFSFTVCVCVYIYIYICIWPRAM